mmetsp:Transcript_6870/g.20571  ORF Transcript_6870/g.20571 Transcript_6870/m.20571 type:complete len:283 (+) Transcript_6870:1675-2523(+)
MPAARTTYRNCRTVWSRSRCIPPSPLRPLPFPPPVPSARRRGWRSCSRSGQRRPVRCHGRRGDLGAGVGGGAIVESWVLLRPSPAARTESDRHGAPRSIPQRAATKICCVRRRRHSHHASGDDEACWPGEERQIPSDSRRRPRLLLPGTGRAISRAERGVRRGASPDAAPARTRPQAGRQRRASGGSGGAPGLRRPPPPARGCTEGAGRLRPPLQTLASPCIPPVAAARRDMQDRDPAAEQGRGSPSFAGVGRASAPSGWRACQILRFSTLLRGNAGNQRHC